MRRDLARRLLCGIAIGAFMAAAIPLKAATNDQPIAEPEPLFVSGSVNTFSGAFLAARTADVDHDFKNAIALYRKALDIDPGNSEIRQRLMISLFLSGDFEAGVSIADSLKDDPNVQRITTITRGLAAIRAKDYAAAEKILVYTGPNDLERMMNSILVAWSRFGAGKTDEALQLIDQLKGPEWFNIFRNYHAGALAAAAGQTEKARKYLNAAVTDRDGGSTAPDTYVRAVVALASLEAQAGNLQKALDAIATGDNFINNYAPLNALRDTIKAGEKPRLQIATATQGAAAVMFSVGSALNRQGADDAVALYLQASNALDPESADTLVLLGGIAAASNQNDRAIDYYRKVPANSPMARISEMQLGLALAQTGKADEARAHLSRLIASDPKDMRSYLAYGSILNDAKDYAAMAANYDRAVEMIGPVAAPSQWSVYFQRGIAYERLKKWDQAEPNFKKALELSPNQPQVLNYLGYSWVDMNLNLKQGLDMIRKAVELRPDDGYIVDSLGWAYFRMGDYANSVTELERAIELKAADATINDHLGDAYWRVGRRFEARYQWQRALNSNPEATEVDRIKGKLANGLPDEPKKEQASSEPSKSEGAPQNDPPANAPAQSPAATPSVNGQADQKAATPEAAAPASNGGSKDYSVQPGDTLWTIAKKLLGDGHRGAEILQLNPALRKTPNGLKPGQVIKVPDSAK